MRWLPAAAVTALLAAVLVLGSGVPWRAEPGEDSLIRLSWRAVGERVDACRDVPPEEQAKLPPHMRRSRICEGQIAPFRLRVRVDGGLLVDETVRASGAREDRPAFVFRELRVPAGEHRVEVDFAAERPPEAAASALAPLAFDERVTLAPRRVLLVTREGEHGGLVAAPPPG